MLVLSCKINDKIIIDDGAITIKVVAKHKGKVQLGFEAPKQLSIHRQKIFDKIKQQNLEGVSTLLTSFEDLKNEHR